MGELLLRNSDARGAATLTLNRPEVHNAFDDALIRALTETLTELGSDDRVRVVVLTGAGRSFCSGADLAWMRQAADYDHESNVRDARALMPCWKPSTPCRSRRSSVLRGLRWVAEPA